MKQEIIKAALRCSLIFVFGVQSSIAMGAEAGRSELDLKKGRAFEGSVRESLALSHERKQAVDRACTHFVLSRALRGHNELVISADLSPDGTHVVSASKDVVRVWYAATGACTHQQNIDDLFQSEWSPDAQQVYFLDKSLRVCLLLPNNMVVWDVGRLDNVEINSYHTVLYALSRDRSRVIKTESIGSRQYVLLPKENGSGENLCPLPSCDDAVDAIACTLDGSRFALAMKKKRVDIHDTVPYRFITSLKADHAAGLPFLFNHKGSLLVTSMKDGSVKIWDIPKAACLHTLEAYVGGKNAVAFNSASSLVACASRDGHVRIWDLGTGRVCQAWCAHEGAVHSVVFSRDDLQLVTASEDGTVKLWDEAAARRLEEPLRQILSLRCPIL